MKRRAAVSAVVLTAILAAAAAVRLWGVTTESLWYDELCAIPQGDYCFAPVESPWEIIPRSIEKDNNPPLYYLVMYFWLVAFGVSEWTLRLPSVFFGVGTVAACGALARRLASDRAGWIAAALAALSPGLVYYSQEARMYQMAAFLVALSSWLLFRAVESDRARDRAAYAVAAACAVYTHYFAVPPVVVSFAWVALRSGWRAPGGRRWIATGCGLLAALVPLTVMALVQAGGTKDYLGGSWTNVFRATVLFGPTCYLPGWGFAAFGAGLSLLFAWRGWRCGSQLREPMRAAGVRNALALAIAATFAAAAALLVVKSAFVPRYALPAAPLFLVLIAFGLAGLSCRAAWIGTVVFLVLSLFARLMFADGAYWKPDWRGAIASVRREIAPAERIYLEDHWANEAARYYGRDLPVLLVRRENVRAFADAARPTLWTGHALDAKGEGGLEDALRARYGMVERYAGRNIRVWRCSRRVDSSP